MQKLNNHFIRKILLRFCSNCNQLVEPKRHVSIGALFVLLLLGIIPGVIYYVLKKHTCPICNSENWEYNQFLIVKILRSDQNTSVDIVTPFLRVR